MADAEPSAATPREIQILETPEDIQARREQVLGRYAQFKDATKAKRQKLEDARRFMYFKRDADELESWIHEKLQTASDESYRDPTNLQVCVLNDSSKHAFSSMMTSTCMCCPVFKWCEYTTFAL